MYNEVMGKNMGYVKFVSVLGKDNKVMVLSRVGMFFIYIVVVGFVFVFLVYVVGFLFFLLLLELIGVFGVVFFLD